MSSVRLALVLLLLSTTARADVLETALAEASAAVKASAAKEKRRRIFPLALAPALAAELAAPTVLDVPLAELRDGPLSAVSAEVAGRAWTVGITMDSGWDDFYLVLTSGADRLLAPLAPIGRFLDRDGVVVSDDEGPVLKLRARVSLLHPIDGTSVVAVDATGGTPSKDSFTVGELIESLRAKGRAARVAGQEIYAFSITEAADGGAALSGERTLVLMHSAGMRTKGFAVPESALEPGRPARASAFGRILILLRTADDRLQIRDAGPAPKAWRLAA